MNKLTCSFLIFFNTLISFSQCEFSIEEILKIGEMNGSQIENFALSKGMSSFEKDAYYCDNGQGMIVFTRKEDEITYTFGTLAKNQYISWKNYVNNNSLFEYKGELLIDGQRYFTYKYNNTFKDKLILGVGLRFTQIIKEDGEWTGAISVSYYY
jgi:hypothetical protein